VEAHLLRESHVLAAHAIDPDIGLAMPGATDSVTDSGSAGSQRRLESWATPRRARRRGGKIALETIYLPLKAAAFASSFWKNAGDRCQFSKISTI
jgi:hypothetical protein